MRVDDRWNRTHNDLEALNLFVDSRENTMNSVLRALVDQLLPQRFICLQLRNKCDP